MISRIVVETEARALRARASQRFWRRVRETPWSLFPPRRVMRLLPTVEEVHRNLRARRSIYIHDRLSNRDDH